MNTPTSDAVTTPDAASEVHAENEPPKPSKGPEVGRAVPSAPPGAQPLPRSSRREETPLLGAVEGGSGDQSLLTSAATVPKQAPPAEPLNCEAPVANINQQAKRLQEVMERAEALPNPAARVLVQECLESVLAFYGEGLARLLEVVSAAEAEGRPVLESLLHDPAVSGLLLIHGLHPLDLETRLRGALDKVRPYMESHGGNVELLGLEEGHARLRLQGTCKSCSASAVTLELAVRSALQEACPDLAGFTVEQ